MVTEIAELFISSKNITLIDHKKKIKIFYLPLEQMYWAIQIQKLIDKFKSYIKREYDAINAIEEYQLAEKLIQINPWAGMVKFARAGGDANAMYKNSSRSTGKTM